MKIVAFIVFIAFSLTPNAPEAPIGLPKAEGSRSFDMEVHQINNLGISRYKQRHFEEALGHFHKALKLAVQLRDPGEGILHFNYALTLHMVEKHDKAARHFLRAKALTRQNPLIQNSVILKMHTNPLK